MDEPNWHELYDALVWEYAETQEKIEALIDAGKGLYAGVEGEIGGNNHYCIAWDKAIEALNNKEGELPK